MTACAAALEHAIAEAEYAFEHALDKVCNKAADDVAAALTAHLAQHNFSRHTFHIRGTLLIRAGSLEQRWWELPYDKLPAIREAGQLVYQLPPLILAALYGRAL